MSCLLRKWLIGSDERRSKNIYIWNSLSGLINAFQSTIILFVLQRVTNETISGLFTIAYATASLMAIIGRYNLRYYQVSDIHNNYSFSSYISHRYCSTVLMVSISILYFVFQILFGHYSIEKVVICILLCLQKIEDSIEDVYYGEYQKRGYLDVAGRALTSRITLLLLVFILSILITHNLIIALVSSTIISFIFLCFVIKALDSSFPHEKIVFVSKDVMSIFKDACPLFLSAFLLQFVISSPKFVIDSALSSDQQAIYGFISMPIFIVSLLSEFIFRPMTNQLTIDWASQNIASFRKRMWMIILIILSITAVCVVGGLLVGLPVLSILFKYPLQSQRLSLAILLVGSGVLSLTSFLGMLLTIMRQQKKIILSYIPSAAIALPIGSILVSRFSLVGASLSYLILISIMLFVTSLFVHFKLRRYSAISEG